MSGHSYDCYIGSCNARFTTLRGLITHMRNSHSEEKRIGLTCNIDGCTDYFNTVSTYRKHVSTCHKERWNDVRFWGRTDCEIPSSSNNNRDFEESHTSLDMNMMPNSPLLPSVPAMYNSFVKSVSSDYALLKLSLEYKYGLSASAVHSVMTDVGDMFKSFKSKYDSCLKTQLSSSSVQDEELLFMVNDDLSVSSAVQLTATSLHTILEDKGYVAPEEILLPGNSVAQKECFHYVSVVKTLKSFVSHEDVYASILKENITNSKLNSYCMGTAMDNHPIFSLDGSALRLILYTDEFQVCNPLRMHSKKHKMAAVYFTVNNIESKFASSLSTIHLALLCKYKYIIKYGYDIVLQPLIRDLKNLETSGLDVEVGSSLQHFAVGVAFLCGDNLSCHTVGGFQMNFNSGRVCRYCMVLYKDIAAVHSEEDCVLRTVSSHDEVLDSLSRDRSLSAVYGITGRSALSELQSFHPVTSLPQDIMHDIYEGLLVVNTTVVLRGLVKNKILTVEQINSLLSEFPYGRNDKTNVHPGLPANFMSKKYKLGGTAAEKWNLFRLLSIIIGPYVPEDNSYWHLHILANEICDILLAPVVEYEWISELQVRIICHHKLWCDLPSDVKGTFIPKLHYLIHSPRQMEIFGPLRHISCMRFEAFHLFFKKIAKSANNFINITKTLSEKFQKRRCLEFSSSSILPAMTITGAKKIVQLYMLPKLQKEVLTSYLQVKSASLVEIGSVFIEGHRLSVKEYVIVDVHDDIPVFFSVDKIFMYCSNCFLYGKLTYVLQFDRHLHAYAISPGSHPNDFVCIAPSQVVPMQHLDMYKVNEVSYIKLRHLPVAP